mgnify:CR=1 FL=1
MKYIVILGDGMADLPVKELGDKTPLDCAKHPNMDFIAANGICGLAKTVPQGMPPEVIPQTFLQWDMIQKYITQDVLL